MLLLLSMFAFADSSHCVDGEVAFMTCSIGAKTLSICGDKLKEPTWWQYRFGPVGAPELVYPAERQGSTGLLTFARRTSMHDESTTFAFTNDGHVYEVIDSTPIHGGSMAGPPFTGILISKDNKQIARLECRDAKLSLHDL